jgi:hypothetical protein
MNISQIQTLIDKLIDLGEDREELMYWASIFDDLTEDKQKLLYENLEEEYKKLSQ